MTRRRWPLVMTTTLTAACVMIACAQQQPKKQPAPPPRPPTLGDLFPPGEPLGLTRSEPEDVTGDDVKAFLGENAAGVYACGALEASRARFAFEGDRELVATLVRFPSPDAARCAWDVDRPEQMERLKLTAGAMADRREARGLLDETQLVVMLKGSRMVRIFLPRGGAGPSRARALAQTLAERMPSDGESTLIPLLPGAGIVAGSARVVSKGPIPTMDGLVATARYTCVEDEALGFVSLRASDDEAKDVRDVYQRTSLEDFMTVNPLRLGEVPVVSVVSVDTHRETMLMHRGKLVMGVADMTRRRDCAPVIETFAALREPSPPDAGVPVVDAGAPFVDGGARR